MAAQTRKARKNGSNKPQAPLTKFVVLRRQSDNLWAEFREHGADEHGVGVAPVKIVEARTDVAAIALVVDGLKDFGSYKAIPLRSWRGGVTYAEPQSVANKQPLAEEFGESGEAA